MTHDEMIAILVAHRDGVLLERRTSGATGPNPPGEWEDYLDDSLPLCKGPWDYRVKPNMVCETALFLRGHRIYVEGGPQVAKILEAEFERREYPMEISLPELVYHQFRLEPA